MRPVVVVMHATYENAYEAIRESIDLAGGVPISSGDEVAIKINLCDARPPHTGVITHPLFLGALLRYLRENFQDLVIRVVESDGAVVLADQYVKWFGFRGVFEQWSVEWCNLSKQRVARVVFGDHLSEEIPVAWPLDGSRLISVSKLKTNSLSRVTTSLKNQFGCLPNLDKSRYHSRLPEAIVDANLAFRPVFCLVDGIVGMVGPKGPSFGVPVMPGLIVAGRDPVAVASASAAILGIRPRSVRHIRLACKAGIGRMVYQLAGDAVAEHVDCEDDWAMRLQARAGLATKRVHRMRFRGGSL